MSKKRDEILNLLCDKSSHKQELFRQTQEHFADFKNKAEEMATWLHQAVCDVDETLELEYEDLNPFEGILRFGGDSILLNMHTNIFTLEKTSDIWKIKYVKEDKKRGYFGVFHLYNFLSDSLRFDRQSDAGVLLCRIFINSEGHYFVEGHRHLARPMGSLHRQKLSPDFFSEILEQAVFFALEFDLTAPPFKEIMQVSVSDMKATRSELQLRTTKKLGYKY